MLCRVTVPLGVVVHHLAQRTVKRHEGLLVHLDTCHDSGWCQKQLWLWDEREREREREIESESERQRQTKGDREREIERERDRERERERERKTYDLKYDVISLAGGGQVANVLDLRCSLPSGRRACNTIQPQYSHKRALIEP